MLTRALDTVSDGLWSLYWTLRFHLSSETQRVTVDGTETAFWTTTFDTYQSVCMDPTLDEKPPLPDLLEHVERDSVVYNVGAYIGTTACVVANAVPEGEVVALEPHPANAERLRANFELNGSENATVYEHALGDRAGSERLLTAQDGPEPSSNTLGTDAVGVHSGYTSIDDERSVEVVQGDEFVEREGLPTPDVVDITTEGTEVAVIEGLSETLRAGCSHVYCEVQREKLLEHDETPESLHETLESLGYEVSVIHGERGDDHYFIRGSRPEV